jgi:hypothetical protein
MTPVRRYLIVQMRASPTAGPADFLPRHGLALGIRQGSAPRANKEKRREMGHGKN